MEINGLNAVTVDFIAEWIRLNYEETIDDIEFGTRFSSSIEDLISNYKQPVKRAEIECAFRNFCKWHKLDYEKVTAGIKELDDNYQKERKVYLLYDETVVTSRKNPSLKYHDIRLYSATPEEAKAGLYAMVDADRARTTIDDKSALERAHEHAADFSMEYKKNHNVIAELNITGSGKTLSERILNTVNEYEKNVEIQKENVEMDNAKLSSTEEIKEREQNTVYISVNKAFCKQVESKYEGSQVYNIMKFPKGTKVGETDLSYAKVNPKIMFDSQFKKNMCTAAFNKKYLEDNAINVKLPNGDKIKVDVDELKKAVDKANHDYMEQMKEKKAAEQGEVKAEEKRKEELTVEALKEKQQHKQLYGY